jgi:RNA polymerase sigma-70 factor (ECF subfamily)
MTPSSHPNNDAELWAEWGRQHWRAVWGYLWGVVRRRDLADDMTQEVFCRAWQARDRYREQGFGRAYLLRIADHLVVDHHRKSGREVNFGDDAWKQIEPVERAGGVDDALQQQEVSAQLASTLDRLSPQQRRVLLLRYYGELSFAEIAAIMKCPIGTVLSYCHRGLHTLRSLLVETDQ